MPKPLTIATDPRVLDAMPDPRGGRALTNYTELDAAVDRMLTHQCLHCHKPIVPKDRGGQCPNCGRWHDGLAWGKGAAPDSHAMPQATASGTRRS